MKNTNKRPVQEPGKNNPRHTEIKICGINACKAVFAKRPTDIIRAYVTEKNLKSFSSVLHYCAQNKKAYRIVTDEELAKLTESTHHEGCCLLIKKTTVLSDVEFLRHHSKESKKTCVIALEHVENPHNIGAILRVCANFGAAALVVTNEKQAQSAAACRTAEGGAEWVPLIGSKNLMETISCFKKAGYQVIGTSSHMGQPLSQKKWSNKVLLLLGSETDGLSQEVLKACDLRLCIRSTGHVESLNVSCAAAIFLDRIME